MYSCNDKLGNVRWDALSGFTDVWSSRNNNNCIREHGRLLELFTNRHTGIPAIGSLRDRHSSTTRTQTAWTSAPAWSCNQIYSAGKCIRHFNIPGIDRPGGLSILSLLYRFTTRSGRIRERTLAMVAQTTRLTALAPSHQSLPPRLQQIDTAQTQTSRSNAEIYGTMFTNPA